MAALPVLLLGVIQARNAARAVAELADRETLLASTSLGREISYMVENRANVTRTFAGEVAASRSIDMDPAGWRAAQYLDIFPGLYGAMILDLDGRARGGMVVEPDGRRSAPTGLSYGDRAWVKEIRDGAPFFSELVRSRLSGKPGMSFAAPVVDRSGARLGLVALGINLERVQRALEREIEAAPGLQAVLLDDTGRVIASAGAGGVKPLENLSKLHLYDAPKADVERRFGPSETGELRVGTAVPIPGAVVRWWVVTTWPYDSIRRRTLGALGTTAAFAGGALALGLFAALMMARAIARPVARVSSLVASIGEGDLRIRRERPEAWYPTELVELTSSIDGMLVQLNPLMTQLGRTVVAIAEATDRLRRATERMVDDSQDQRDAVKRSTGAIVQIRDSIGRIADGVRNLSRTASETTASIVNFDRQTHLIAGSVRALAETVEGASVDAVQLEQQVGAVAGSAMRLSENVATTTASLELLTESIENVGAGAQRGEALARDALGAARSGFEAVDATVGSMTEIKLRFDRVGETVSRLARRSEAIGDVVRVIDEITRATRLLAINASIISSAAGEHGSGFGVVADRVRSLASETAASTDQIRDLITSVQTDIQEAVAAVDSGHETVRDGEARSKEAGTRLRVIIESAGQSEKTAHEIVRASGDQARRVDALAAAVEEVQTATGRISAAASTQRVAHEKLALAIAKVGTVCADVRASTGAQQAGSRAMTGAVAEMTRRLEAIAEASEAQSRERDRIEEALAGCG
jgi:methyl-accepting chemotaxis protein